MHAFSLKIHSSDILNSEEEMKKKLINVNAAHQQFNKIMSQWRAIQNSASQIQKEQQQKNAKFLLIKAAWEGIYCKI